MSETSEIIPIDPSADTHEYEPCDPGELKIIKRNGAVETFSVDKMRRALIAVFKDSDGAQIGDIEIREKARSIAHGIMHKFTQRHPDGGALTIHDLRDAMELELMRSGAVDAARAFVLHQARKIDKADDIVYENPVISQLQAAIKHICGDDRAKEVIEQTRAEIYEGISQTDAETAVLGVLRSRIERDPECDQITARWMLRSVREEVIKTLGLQENAGSAAIFRAGIQFGVNQGFFDKRLELLFDIDRLAEVIDFTRDLQYDYLGVRTLYDRYLAHQNKQRYELPQTHLMRIAMGLSLLEEEPTKQAIEFYDTFSSFRFMPSTPTLFNSGTAHPQLSSCFLSTMEDSLKSIFAGISENAMLSKWSGGIGNDWTRIRGLGSHIKGTNGTSNGVVPFLKIANDTAVAVNQGGKRKGAVCAYLEAWHIDIADFIEMRKNTGDDRRRTPDMNTAIWIPDLFMRRMRADESWTLFSPDVAPKLHDLYGREFEEEYTRLEGLAEINTLHGAHCTVSAKMLYRNILSMLFETGHPWLTFKDPCNLRSPQQHVGVVHSSNLCTEITLNSSDEETAVCNLGSVNLMAHMREKDNGKMILDEKLMRETVRIAMRALDNVLDINLYPTPKAQTSNRRHRPVGLGMMGFADALCVQNIAYASEAGIAFADQTAEILAHAAIDASTDLAAERGVYPTYKGSLWDQGIMPLDSIALLQSARDAGELEVNLDTHLGQAAWDALREKIAKQGMRNSNCTAIAPTATIAGITRTSASVEPIFRCLHVRSTLSGEFTMINQPLVKQLKQMGVWSEVLASDLKYKAGSVQSVNEIPDAIKDVYKTAFEIEPQWLIEAASRRQKWLDQAQSLNIYIGKPSGRLLSKTYEQAWIRGLKTTYYLRTLGATSTEAATMEQAPTPVSEVTAPAPPESPSMEAGAACGLTPSDECEVCQ